MKRKKTDHVDRIRTLYQKYMDHEISEDEFNELLNSSFHPEFSAIINEPLRKSWAETKDEGKKGSTNGRSNPSKKGGGSMKSIGMWIAAAAAAALVLFTTTPWRSSTTDGWIIYNTGYAETLEIDLSDGSKVLLNASSELRWKNDWASSGKRLAHISGEAYFHVNAQARDGIKVPFLVESKEVRIEVVGTSFNIEDYGDETKVFLNQGQIKLGLLRTSDSTVYLTDGDQVVIENQTHQVLSKTQTSKQEAASWTEGELRFKDVNLGKILPQLEAIYGVEFEVEDSAMLEIPMDFGVPYANWAVVQSALELALTVDLHTHDGKIYINKIK